MSVLTWLGKLIGGRLNRNTRRRLRRQKPREGWRLGLEALEDRLSPAISLIANPVWLAQGPTGISGGQVTGLNSQSDPVSGAVQRLAVDPSDANVLYAGTINGGVWKTTNATSLNPIWVPLTDDQESLSIGALAMDGADGTHQTLVAGFGNFSSLARRGGPLAGLIKTTDGGASWTSIDGAASGGNLRDKSIVGVTVNGPNIVVAVDSAQPFLNGNLGIFRSTDNGSTFLQISGAATTGLPAGACFDLTADPTDPATLFTNVRFSQADGIYRSGDGGATWVLVSNMAMDTLLATADNVKIAVGRSNNVFVGIIVQGQAAGIFHSLNGGNSWNQMDLPSTNEGGVIEGLQPEAAASNPPPFPAPGPNVTPGSQGSIHFSLAADPTNPNIVYAGGDRQPFGAGPGGFPNSIGAVNFTGRLFRGDATLPAGGQWTAITDDFAKPFGAGGGTAPHADSRVMVFDALGDLIQGDDGGIYRRSNPRSSNGVWTAVVGNMGNTEVVHTSYDPIGKAFIIGTQDVGTAVQEVTPNTPWSTLSQGDGGITAVDASGLQSIRYSTFIFLANFQRTTWDASNTQVGSQPVRLLIANGPNANQNLSGFTDPTLSFYQTYSLNAVDPTRMVINTNNLYESADRGDTLFDLTGDTGNPITAVAYGGRRQGVANADVLYYFSGGAFFLRTAANPAPFTQLTNYPGVGAVEMVLDPDDWHSVFVLDTQSRIWHSTNAGVSWQNVTGNLVGSFESIAISKIAGLKVLVAGGPQRMAQMFLTDALNWTTLGSGLPHALVSNVDSTESGDMLYVGTVGRGVWAIPKFNETPGTLNVSGSLGDDIIRIVRNAADPTLNDIFINALGVPTAQVTFANLTQIQVDGLGGNDQLIVDYSNGAPVPAGGLSFDGGSQNNVLTVQGGSFSSISHDVSGASAGSLSLGALAGATTISYAASASVELAPAATTTFTFNDQAGSDTIVVGDDATASDNISQIQSSGALFATTSFVTPASSLTLNLNGGDALDLNGFDALYTAGLTVTGAGAVDITAPLNLLGSAAAPADLNISAATIDINADVTTGNGGSITFANTGALTVGANVIAAGSFTQQGSGAVSLGGDVTSSSGQNYSGPVALTRVVNTLSGSVIRFQGDLDLGSAILDINGNIAFDATASVSTQLNGSGPTQFGHITRTGTADLGGATLQIARLPSFQPPEGTVLAIVGENSNALLFNTWGNLLEGQILDLAGWTYRVVYQGGIGGNDFALVSIAGPASKLDFGQGPTNVRAGEPINPFVTVRIEDDQGNQAADSTSTISLSVASGPGTLLGTFNVQAVDGLATFNTISLQRAGTYTLQATSGAHTAATSGSFVVRAADATKLAFAANPINGVAGQALPNVRVQLQDGFGNVSTTSAANVSITVTGPGGFSAGTTTVPSASGVATFQGLELRTAGTYTFTVTAPGLTSAQSTSFTISPASPDRLVYEAQPVDTVAGQPLADLRIDILDVFGNFATGVPVTVSVIGPAGFSAGTTTVQDQQGVATFSGLTLTKTGSYTLSVSAPNLTPVASNSFVISAAAANKLTFESSPTNALAGQVLANLRVNVQDAFNNLVGSAVPVDLTVNGPGVLSAGNTTATTVNGIATFSGLVLTRAGSYTFSASASQLANATTNSFTISAAAASRIGFAAPIADITAGQAVPNVRAQVQDDFGNLVSSASAIITLSSSGPATIGANATTSQGTATFQNLVLTKAGSYSFTATSPGFADGTSNTFTVTAAAATRLGFANPPASLVAGVAIPGLQVEVRDAFGNVVPGSSAAVTLAAAGPGPLSGGATTINASAGIALFTGLALEKAGSYQLQASASGLTTGATPAFSVTPAAASQLAFQGTLADTTAGQPLPTFKVDVRDAFGNLVNSATPVTLSANGPGTLIGNTTVTSSSGVASFPGIVVERAGSYTVTAASAGLAAATSSSFTISAAAASQLAFEGAPANTTAGQIVPDVRVAVRDAFGNPVSGRQVTLNAQGPGNFKTGAATATGVNGVATFQNLVLESAGSYNLSATSAGIPAATSSAFVVSAAAPQQLGFDAALDDAVAGQALADVRVSVRDAFGNAVNSAVTVNIAAVGPGALSGSTSANTSGGVAIFSGLILQTAGSYTLSASAVGLGSVASSSFTVNPGAPFELEFLALPASVTAGQALPNVQVEVSDEFDNTIDGVTVTLDAAGPAGFSAGSSSATSVGGIATFSGLVLERAGVYNLDAATAGVAPTSSAAFTVTAAVPSKLAFVGTIADVTAGNTLPAIQVEVADAFGNRVDTSALVHLSLSAGSFVVNPPALVATSGLATFSGLVLQKAGSYTLNAAASGLTVAASNSFTVNPAAARQLGFPALLADTLAGQSLAPVQVEVQDAFGNRIPGASAPVSIAATGPGNFSGGATTAFASGGLASFNGLILQTAGSYTLNASAPGLASGTSPRFNISAAAASRLAFAGSPVNATAGQAQSDLQVQVLDAFGNVATSSSANVTLVHNGPAAPNGTTTVAASAGIATFPNLVFTAAGSYTLSARAAGLTSGSSGAFTISAAAAQQLAFLTGPVDRSAGQTLPAVQVTVRDAFGNAVSNVPVQLAASPNAPSSGATSATSVAGIASFAGLAFNTTGAYTLTASAPGVPAAVSGVFAIRAGAATRLAFLTQPAATVAGQPLPDIRIGLQDAFGNLTADSGIVVSLTGSGAASVGATATTAQGVASFNGFTLTVAGTYTLSAGAAALPSSVQSGYTVSPASASQVTFARSVAGATAGQALAPIQVELRDAFGNLVNTSAPVTISANGPGSFAAGNTTLVAAAGSATFTGLLLNRAGSYTLSAAAPGMTAGTSTSFTISPAAASQLQFNAFPTTGTAGQVMPDLVVRLLDAFGNLATTGAQVSLNIGGPGTPSGGSTTNPAINGIATFSGLTFSRAGSYTIAAASPGLAAGTPLALTIAAAAGTRFVFTTLPVNTTAGQALPDLQVQILDAYGNVANSNSLVTIAVSGPGAPSGGTSTVQAVQGTATFKGIVLPLAGSYNLYVSAAGVATAASGVFTAAPGTTTPGGPGSVVTPVRPRATRLRVSASAVRGRAGLNLPPLRIQVLDQFGRRMPAGTLVRVRLRSGRITGLLSRRTNRLGQVIFTGLKIARPGRYTLIVSAAGLSRTTSIRVTVIA